MEIDSRLEGYTVADLMAALGSRLDGPGDSSAGVRVDGCWHSAGTPLSAVPIWEGALLEIAPGSGQSPSQSPKQPAGPALGASSRGQVLAVAAEQQPAGPALGASSRGQVLAVAAEQQPVGSALGASSRGQVLAVTAGLRAGSRHRPPPIGTWTIGRSVSCDVVLDDPAVSRRHTRVSVERPGARPVVADLGSHNGTVVAGRAVTDPAPVPAGATVRLGATCLQWRTERDDAPAAVSAGLGAAAGRIPFNRPPRRRPPTSPATLRVPAEPPPRPEPEPLSWAGIALPVVAGLVLALVWNPFMAVFAALGPLITIGTWLERRRRSTRAHRRACEDTAARVKGFVAALPAEAAAERLRRLALVPDLAELVRRAETPSLRCWERRQRDPDAMRLGVGTADVPYSPPIEVDGDGGAAPQALEALEALEPLRDVPVAVSLAPGDVVGIVGPLPAARAVARSLVLQAAVLHGPADLAVAGLAPGGAREWSWLRWLPHTADAAGGGPGALAATEGSAMRAAAETAAAGCAQRILLAVIDGTEALTGRSAPGRTLLALRSTAGIIVTTDVCDLPSNCTTIVQVDHSAGGLRLVDPRSAAKLAPLVAWGVTIATATHAAARLARLDDPELGSHHANLPESVSLVDLMDGEPTPESVSQRWQATRGTADLRVPIGATAEGPLVLDLVVDGPHLLIGGTTGSGKSELLRSLVAGLALSADPDHLALVLIDYKGGAAFDRCAEMPHVAGMVTDLDDRLAERALVCLEAELRHREERLRAAGAEDLAAFRARSGPAAEPLPRLVVVVDEFATLAAELPDFLHSLVGIAQRGRSLGVHMVLATQRPAGVVTDDIRANTSCRIALRVTDRHDSNDVIDSPAAARIPRQRPGQALARLGPGELVAFQSALVTGTTPRGSGGLRVGAGGQAPGQDPSEFPGGSGSEPGGDPVERNDLDAVVDAVTVAHRRRGGRAPRPPWPKPLPLEVSAGNLPARVGPGEPAAWLVDDPSRQRQFVGGWHPGQGHLVVVGGPASGTSTTLASVALDLCRSRDPDDLHIYALDLDAGLLTALERLPHVGAVIAPTDGERRARLLRLLDDEVTARRAGGASAAIVLLVDDLAGLARAHDPVRDPEPHQRFARIWSDGAAVGVTVAVSVARAADLPPELAASAGVVLVHATSDAGDGLRFGLRTPTAGLAAGRAVRAGDGLEVQIARPVGGDFASAAAEVAASAAPAERGPARIGSLPPRVCFEDLPGSALSEDRRIDLRFAMGDLSLAPTGFALHDGEHALVIGPPRTGRTCALAAVGAAARCAGVEVVVVGDRPGDLARLLGVEPVPVGELDTPDGRRRLMLVDDADRVSDPSGLLARLAAGGDGSCHLVVSATAERLRSSYGHWLNEMRTCRTGVLFRPGPLDGDLLGAALPARLEPLPVPGRGLVVADGAAAVAQVALVGAAA
ncbi:MAG: FtsK/SpoIIIE domain-containing protein [Acidimicrobiaceae bacterium]|nr:FtsK/SpoIIIE domain-containing protein [Acidimicrobiaceae bacterium]